MEKKFNEYIATMRKGDDMWEHDAATSLIDLIVTSDVKPWSKKIKYVELAILGECYRIQVKLNASKEETADTRAMVRQKHRLQQMLRGLKEAMKYYF